MPPINLSAFIVEAEIVTVVQNLVTLQDEVLIYLRWLGTDGKEVYRASFMIVEIE